MNGQNAFPAWVLNRFFEIRKTTLVSHPAGHFEDLDTQVRYHSPNVFSNKEAAQETAHRRLAAMEHQLKLMLALHEKRKASVDQYTSSK